MVSIFITPSTIEHILQNIEILNVLLKDGNKIYYTNWPDVETIPRTFAATCTG
jgi:hypothetical protein